MGRLVWGVLAGVSLTFASQAADFDDRWYISGSAGGAVTDSSDFDAGLALYGAIGKTLYPRLSIEGEVAFEDINVSNVGSNSFSDEYKRIGGGLKATYDLLQFDRVALGFLIGASVREIKWLAETQTGLSSFAGLGLRTVMGPHAEFLLEGRYILDPVDEGQYIDKDTYYFWTLTAGVRYNIGQWPPPEPDSDGDGVVDRLDECPNTPRGVQVTANGCPIDSDGDGVPDYRDRCPNTPAGVLVDEHGCPLDSDGDGVIDPFDKCPDTPPGVPVDADGCPLDSDQDGVVNSKDLCPNTPYGAEVDVNGCPFDTDQDGVPDFRDACPNTPYGQPVNDRGCSRDDDADGVENEIDQCPNTFPGLEVDKVGCPLRNQVITLHNVHFEFDRADLLPDSRQLLAKVAKSLNDQPDLRIQVAGHTDSMGSDEYNLRLSDRRAASVRNFLATQGLSPSNLSSKGYGESAPIAENATDEGRALNRRVEIHLLD